jgi:hypothetical protein
MKCILIRWSKNKLNDDRDIMIDGMQIEVPFQADRSVFSKPYIFFAPGSQEFFLKVAGAGIKPVL